MYYDFIASIYFINLQFPNNYQNIEKFSVNDLEILQNDFIKIFTITITEFSKKLFKKF